MIACLLALCALTLVAGCGGGGGKSAKDKYDEAYKPINDQVLAMGQEVGTAVSTAKGKTDVTLASQFSGLSVRVTALKSRLDGLKSPDEYESDAANLSAALQLAAADLKAISNAAAAHRAGAAADGVRQLAADSISIRDARRALAKKTGAKV